MPVQRPERHHGHDRHAVGVGDDADMAGDRVRVHLRHHQRDAGSMRNAEELSTTTAPCRTAIGANRRDTAPPAENSAMSTPGKLSSFSSSTAIPSPRNSSLRPAERPEANRRNRSSGKARRFQAGDQFAADRAGGADNGDDGMVQAHELAPFVGPVETSA